MFQYPPLRNFHPLETCARERFLWPCALRNIFVTSIPATTYSNYFRATRSCAVARLALVGSPRSNGNCRTRDRIAGFWERSAEYEVLSAKTRSRNSAATPPVLSSTSQAPRSAPRNLSKPSLRSKTIPAIFPLRADLRPPPITQPAAAPSLRLMGQVPTFFSQRKRKAHGWSIPVDCGDSSPLLDFQQDRSDDDIRPQFHHFSSLSPFERSIRTT
jgi:hypothetical protein